MVFAAVASVTFPAHDICEGITDLELENLDRRKTRSVPQLIALMEMGSYEVSARPGDTDRTATAFDVTRIMGARARGSIIEMPRDQTPNQL